MLDAFLKVACGRAQAELDRDNLVEKMRALPPEYLYKLATGEEKLAYIMGGCDPDWLEKFKGTPFFEHAIELEKQELQQQMAEQTRYREEEQVRTERSAARDEIQVQRKLLELELASHEAGGAGLSEGSGGPEGDPGAEGAEPFAGHETPQEEALEHGEEAPSGPPVGGPPEAAAAPPEAAQMPPEAMAAEEPPAEEEMAAVPEDGPPPPPPPKPKAKEEEKKASAFRFAVAKMKLAEADGNRSTTRQALGGTGGAITGALGGSMAAKGISTLLGAEHPYLYSVGGLALGGIGGGIAGAKYASVNKKAVSQHWVAETVRKGVQKASPERGAGFAKGMLNKMYNALDNESKARVGGQFKSSRISDMYGQAAGTAIDFKKKAMSKEALDLMGLGKAVGAGVKSVVSPAAAAGKATYQAARGVAGAAGGSGVLSAAGQGAMSGGQAAMQAIPRAAKTVGRAGMSYVKAHPYQAAGLAGGTALAGGLGIHAMNSGQPQQQ